MYRIMSQGRLVDLCDEPRYVRKKPSTGVWIQTDESNAEAIAVRGVLYNLPNKPTIENIPVADIIQVTSDDMLSIISLANENLFSKVVPDLEDAVVELGEYVDESTTDNSNAIIDLADYVVSLEKRIATLEGGKE